MPAPVGGSVGGCGARAVSRKTPIYFILLKRLRCTSKRSTGIRQNFGYFVENLHTFWCFGVKNIVFGACEYFWAGLGGDCCGGEVGVSSPHPLSSILPQPVPQLTCASYVISARFKS